MGCLLLSTAATLFAAPDSAGRPVPIFYAVLQEAKPSLEPSIDELRERVGKTAEVTFTVMTVGGKSNLYLNSQKNWQEPDCFTAMLVPAARDELKKLGFDDPFDDLIGRQARCRGELELDRDRVRIVVKDFAKQFELVGADQSAADAQARGQQQQLRRPRLRPRNPPWRPQNSLPTSILRSRKFARQSARNVR